MVMTTSSSESKKPCDDMKCPFHGNLHVRGRVLKGTVISTKMDKTVVVSRDHQLYVPKFKRYERRHNHLNAHNPPCLNVKEGEKVMIAECRPISKTVSFVVVERIGELQSGS
jgi:small subunit ribosomal protein S17